MGVEKAKVKDEFDEKDKKPKPEEEKIIITPVVLPEKAPEPSKVVEEPPKVEEEPDLGPKPKDKVKDEFAEKEKKAKEEAEKIIITPKELPKKIEEEEESSEEEEEEEEKPAPKKLSVADLKPAVQIKVAAPEEKKPLRRPKRQETVEESFLDAPPVEKAKVKDQFDEREKKAKEEAEKIVIKPATLPVKEESSSEEEEEEKPAPKKKLSKADLKPAVQIKVAATPEPTVARRKKKDDDEPVDNLFDGVPEAKPKVKDEFAEKDKKPKEEEKIVIKPATLPVKAEESSSDEEEEEKPAPKKKLSAADLKPAVQIKVAATPEPAVTRRKKKDDDEPQESLFDNLPAVKPKVKDEFAEKEK